MSFDRIAVGIKTFLRDDKLFHTINHVRRNLPDAQLMIADDGEMTEEKESLYAELIQEGHKVFILPFDSGYGAKSNKIIDNLQRDFLLVGSDDFDFSPASVSLGIERLVAALDRSPELSLVSGRLANRGSYEFYIRDQGDIIEEIPIPDFYWQTGWTYQPADLTVNYSLIRRNVFWTEGLETNENGTGWVEKRTSIAFDDEEVIGEGGHGTFFLDVKRAGLKVGFVPGVEISEQTGEDSLRYRQYRARASRPSRKCFEKRNIRRWVLGNGVVDYNKE